MDAKPVIRETHPKNAESRRAANRDEYDLSKTDATAQHPTTYSGAVNGELDEERTSHNAENSIHFVKAAMNQWVLCNCVGGPKLSTGNRYRLATVPRRYYTANGPSCSLKLEWSCAPCARTSWYLPPCRLDIGRRSKWIHGGPSFPGDQPMSEAGFLHFRSGGGDGALSTAAALMVSGAVSREVIFDALNTSQQRGLMNHQSMYLFSLRALPPARMRILRRSAEGIPESWPRVLNENLSLRQAGGLMQYEERDANGNTPSAQHPHKAQE
ncbi:hypothetical protein B0H11DRAFT_1933808 [Mycena galericulata]|nr:hypothetical protein B0H11DRAFT_1933808 [Mycena galericulata]